MPQVLARLEQTLRALEAPVVSVAPLGIYENAMVAHFEVLVISLLVFAAVAAGIGTLGLGSAVSVSVVERTRELGVLRAIGAAPSKITAGLVIEGVSVAVVSAVASLILGGLLAWALGSLVGVVSFALPLPFTLSGAAAVAWGAGVILLSAAATWWPAQRAARQSVVSALRYV